MKDLDCLKLTNELKAIIGKYSDEEIEFFRELIKKTDNSVVNYLGNILMSGDGSDGKSK